MLTTLHCGGHFLLPNNSLGIYTYTAALSIKIYAPRGIFFEFSDGIMAAVFLPIC
nr:MAG TPA: cyanase [Caudoviricetes sp.]